MKKVFLLSVVMFMSFVIVTQAKDPDNVSTQKLVGGLSFNELNHEFGTLKESDGNASTDFTFINKTDKPVVITSVSASCGCTSPSWTKEPIAPGASGTIKATYSVAGRIGAFDKTITVITSADPSNIVLRIKGTVTK